MRVSVLARLCILIIYALMYIIYRFFFYKIFKFADILFILIFQSHAFKHFPTSLKSVNELGLSNCPSVLTLTCASIVRLPRS